MNLLVSERTNLIGGDFRHGDGPSVKDSKFNLATGAAFIEVNDRSDKKGSKRLMRM